MIRRLFGFKGYFGFCGELEYGFIGALVEGDFRTDLVCKKLDFFDEFSALIKVARVSYGLQG
jgi:hypothetical protein